MPGPRTVSIRTVLKVTDRTHSVAARCEGAPSRVHGLSPNRTRTGKVTGVVWQDLTGSDSGGTGDAMHGGSQTKGGMHKCHLEARQGRGPRTVPRGVENIGLRGGIRKRIVRGEYQGEASARIKARFSVEPGAEESAQGGRQSVPDRPLGERGDPPAVERRQADHDGARPGSRRGRAGRIRRDSEERARSWPCRPKSRRCCLGLRVLAMVKHNDNGWAGFKADSCVRAPAQAANEGW